VVAAADGGGRFFDFGGRAQYAIGAVGIFRREGLQEAIPR
jgi:hypothetical protein